MDYAMSKPMSAKQMAAQEKQWRAESDVRTLVEAAKICADEERHKLAMAKVADMRKELDDIKAMREYD
jgi:hypothetical protein